jgi:ureidoglycolate hydrolase
MPADTVAAYREVLIQPLTPEAFAAFGTVIPPTDDGIPLGAGDARLDLSQGTPRFYAMRIPGRGFTVTRITRHCKVTQVLASAGGKCWVMGVAPPLGIDDPSIEPDIEDVRAFAIPGDVAIMLHKGTWHAGPLFAEGTKESFFNLELSDTNKVDHQTCDLSARHGLALKLVTA